MLSALRGRLSLRRLHAPQYVPALLCLITLLQVPAVRSADIVRLASLEWPPYTGSQLPQRGSATATVVAALQAEGYEVQIDFLPWERALALAQSSDSGYDGYFPEYYAAHIEAAFIFSPVIGSGPLGFVHHREVAFEWQTLTDLQAYTLGVVEGYVNTAALDAAIADGRQAVEAVSSDQLNLRKVAAKRIPAAVIDENVMNYWLEHDPLLAHAREQLRFHPQLLEQKLLYLCFRRSPRGEQLAAALAKGLAKTLAVLPAGASKP